MDGRSRMLSWIALSLTITTLVAVPSAAAGALDQSQEATGGASTTWSGPLEAAQTFTAGPSGVLDQVDVNLIQFNNPGDVVVAIRATSGGAPTGTDLVNATIAESDLPHLFNAWVSVPLPPLTVSAGTQYAIVLYLADPVQKPPGVEIDWMGGNGDPYAGGVLQSRIDPSSAWETPFGGDLDHAFRTYVTPAPATPSCNGQTATIYVNAQNVVGGPGNGQPYRGKLNGTSGNDVMVGTTGNDEFAARGGNDVLCGLEGNDEMEGGGGNDMMTGGTGADEFQGGAGSDTASDFAPGEGDTGADVEFAPNSGSVKICKAADGAGVAGTRFTFAAAGQTLSVRAGAPPNGRCTSPVLVSAGTLTITEQALAGFTLTDIFTLPADRLISENLAARSATVTIVPGGMTQVVFANRVA